jgi:hypothetical protein
VKSGEEMFKITTVFPHLPKEYMKFLPTIGAKLGIQLEIEDTMASRLVKSMGMSLVKLLVFRVRRLPELIHLPLPRGGRIDKKVEYLGLPNRWFACRQVGHLVRNCPNPKRQIGSAHHHKNGIWLGYLASDDIRTFTQVREVDKQQEIQQEQGTYQHGESSQAHD